MSFNSQFSAEIVCEELHEDLCAFSIASSGKRCLLETDKAADGGVEYQCRTSEVVVERMVEYIETNQCVNACGVERNFVGFSSDALLEPEFTTKLCSPSCFQNCPNIIDLYFNLAAGEGKKFLILFSNKILYMHEHGYNVWILSAFLFNLFWTIQIIGLYWLVLKTQFFVTLFEEPFKSVVSSFNKQIMSHGWNVNVLRILSFFFFGPNFLVSFLERKKKGPHVTIVFFA